MKKLILQSIFLLLICLSVNKLSYSQIGYKWTQKTSIPGNGRAGAVAFTTNGSAYVGLGSNGTYLNDFYKYDFATDTWSQKANYPNSMPGAGSVSNGTYGVVGLGTVNHTDCYKYDSLNNQWIQVANFGGSGRYDVSSFNIGNKGYLGMGIDNVINYNDLWEYDFSNNTWSQKASIPVGTRYGCFSFAINGKGYIGGGCSDNNTHYSDFYEYDPTSNSWTQKASFGGGTRSFGSGFSMIGRGYAGLGRDGFGGSNVYTDFWEYNPSSDSWSKIDSFPGLPRIHGISFSNNDLGYVGTGVDPVSSNAYSDIWELDTIMPAPTPTPCYANFTVFPDPNVVGLYFGYNNSTGSNISCTWNWGDNTSDTGMYPIHFYQNPGTYTIKLMINGVLCADSFNVSYAFLRTSNGNGMHKITILKPGTGLGINNLNSTSKFNVFPNPCSDELHFDLINDVNKNKVTITNINGQKLIETMVTSKSINISNLEKGVYFLELTNEKGEKFRSYFTKD